MGPIIEPPLGKLAEGLTTLERGESWLLAPHQQGDDPRVWTPGIRDGVRPGSTFHRTEYFGPILGVMHAKSLAQAIEWQNATDYGLTAGIHSLDADEVNTWIDEVQAGNLYVNRGTTGAIVQRQPFGGWKRSSVGTTAKAGGPNYLTHLGSWRSRPLRKAPQVKVLPEVEAILDAAKSLVTPTQLRELREAAGSDEKAWRREYGVMKDISALGVERNVFRYVPVPVTIRFDGSNFELVRVLIAAARTGAPITVSSPAELPEKLVHRPRVEVHNDWLAYVAAERPSRVRLIGSKEKAKDIATAVGGDPDVAIYAGPVTLSGRVEALPFLKEQAISITNHRFGNRDAEFEWVLPR
jgi:RHH-type proline utilization regulon transcriptional repressor/proline dehydrogenase/delta 1-pyrroline-5-carboxylate dehydrogenase